MKLQSVDMNMHFNEVPHLRLLIAGVAVILFGTSGIAAVMAWMPGSADMADDVVALDRLAPPVRPAGAEAQISAESAEGDARSRAKCEECGIVASLRDIEQPAKGNDPAAGGGMARGTRNEMGGKPARRYEVTVRMQDGSSRVFMQAAPVNWRAGERLILIAGANHASN